MSSSSFRSQGMGVPFPERPSNQRTVDRDPDIVQLHHGGIQQPRLHVHGEYIAQEKTPHYFAARSARSLYYI